VVSLEKGVKMFSIGDRVVIKDCSVYSWIGRTGTVIATALGSRSLSTSIRLDVPFEDDILGPLTTMELYHHRYELIQPREPDWEV
jgi:hypothetical protein